MTDRPIIFTAPMILALLDGSKTMTRRLAWRDFEAGQMIIRPNETEFSFERKIPAGSKIVNMSQNDWDFKVFSPTLWQKAKPGDRLWVKETWQTGMTENGPQISYRANPDYCEIDAWVGEDFGAGPSFDYDKCPHATWHTWLPDLLSGAEGNWRPSIFMPRWASRLTLAVTAVKIERLQDISIDDIEAEGVYRVMDGQNCTQDLLRNRGNFMDLWNALHGPDAWDADPEVVALTFDVHQCNIDKIDKAS